MRTGEDPLIMSTMRTLDMADSMQARDQEIALQQQAQQRQQEAFDWQRVQAQKAEDANFANQKLKACQDADSNERYAWAATAVPQINPASKDAEVQLGNWKSYTAGRISPAQYQEIFGPLEQQVNANNSRRQQLQDKYGMTNFEYKEDPATKAQVIDEDATHAEAMRRGDMQDQEKASWLPQDKQLARYLQAKDPELPPAELHDQVEDHRKGQSLWAWAQRQGAFTTPGQEPLLGDLVFDPTAPVGTAAPVLKYDSKKVEQYLNDSGQGPSDPLTGKPQTNPATGQRISWMDHFRRQSAVEQNQELEKARLATQEKQVNINKTRAETEKIKGDTLPSVTGAGKATPVGGSDLFNFK